MPAKSRQQIALEYGVCTKTLNKWLRSAGINLPRGIVTPNHQKIIYEEFGVPNFTSSSPYQTKKS